LVDQDYKAIKRYWPDAPVGVNSAGLGRRDTAQPIIVAHPLSIVRNVKALGKRHVVAIDEVHNVSRKQESSTYGKIISQLRAAVPDLRILGLTGTAYRLDSGLLWDMWRGVPSLWDAPVSSYNMLDGIRDGYLVPVIARRPAVVLDVSGVGEAGGEFVEKQLQKAVDKDELNEAIVEDIIKQTYDRNSVIVFATGIEHAEHLHELFVEKGASAVVVHGEMADAQRDERIDYFRRGAAKFIINVGILTTGFDHPPCDCAALVRPTKSKGLLVQAVGRIMRAHPGKANSLALDYAGNFTRLGVIDQLAESKVAGAPGKPPTKTCPDCDAIVAASKLRCECGHEWEKGAPALTSIATDAAVLSTQQTAKWFDVKNQHFSLHSRRMPDGTQAPASLRISYWCGGSINASEFLAFNSPRPGGQFMARNKWRQRSVGVDVPATSEDALGMTADIRVPARIQLRKDGKYWEVVALDYSIAAKEAVTTNMMTDSEVKDALAAPF
jgi:DNA repair protein RadD